MPDNPKLHLSILQVPALLRDARRIIRAAVAPDPTLGSNTPPIITVGEVADVLKRINEALGDADAD